MSLQLNRACADTSAQQLHGTSDSVTNVAAHEKSQNTVFWGGDTVKPKSSSMQRNTGTSVFVLWFLHDICVDSCRVLLGRTQDSNVQEKTMLFLV